MTSLEEIAGGEYVLPIQAGAWAQNDFEEMVGFIPSADGDVTVISFSNGNTCTDVYTGCFAGHYYKFRNPVISATFGMGVSAIFQEG